MSSIKWYIVQEEPLQVLELNEKLTVKYVESLILFNRGPILSLHVSKVLPKNISEFCLFQILHFDLSLIIIISDI